MADPNVMVDDGTGTLRRAQLVAQASGDIVYPENEKSTNVQVRGADGKLHRAQLVAMIGSGGSDQHNLGYYATVAELEEAHPTAEAGDWAIVAESDTVYIWDDTQQAWVDTDRKGQVESVNGKTGAVVLNAEDVGAQSATPYEYTAELEFTPNVDYDGAVIIELLGDKAAALQISQYVDYEDGGVWYEDPDKDAEYVAFMQPSLDPEDGNSKVIWTSPINRLIFMDAQSRENQNGQPVLSMRYEYAGSGLEEDHCKIILKIISDKELVIRTSKDPSEYPFSGQSGVMTLPIKDYNEDDQTPFYPVQRGGLINWEPIPEVKGLPTQTGQSGKFLTTNGTDASWSDKPLVNQTTGHGIVVSSQNFTNPLYTNSNTVIVTSGTSIPGYYNASSQVLFGTIALVGGGLSGWGASAFGIEVSAKGTGALALGAWARAEADYAIQLGTSGGITTNSDTNTMKVANHNGNFEMMSADGTIPTARLTKVNTTITLAAADWSSNTQTVSVTGMTATGVVFVSPDPTDQSAYTSAGIICSVQAAGTLTFTCDTVPSGDIDVNVVML